MRLSVDEDALLRHLYLTNAVSSDDLAKHPSELDAFVEQWRNLSGRNDTTEDVLHYIIVRRKTGRWVRLDGKQRKVRVNLPLLSPEYWSVLQSTYDEIVASHGLGSDNLGFNPELLEMLVAEFSKRVEGTTVWPGWLIFSALMAKRKRGQLVKIQPSPDGEPGIGFSDIGDAATG